MEKVRSKSGAPIADDFDNKDGTPIVIDSVTGRAYVLLDNGTIKDISLTNAQLASLAALSFTGNYGNVIRVNVTEDGFELVAGGGIPWSRITGNTNVVQGRGYILAANSIVCTLPSAVLTGIPIYFITETAVLTGCSVARNGNTIMALAEDMTIDNSRHWFFSLAGDATTSDWRLT